MMKKTTLVYFAPALLILFLGSCADFFQDRVPMNGGTTKSGSLGTLVNPPRALVIETLSPPNQLFIESGGSHMYIRLSWSKVTGASSYIVERAVVEPLVDGFGNVSYPTPEGGDFAELDRVFGYSWTDEIFGPGNTAEYTSPEYRNRYYYQVRADNLEARLEPSDPTPFQWGTLFAPPGNVKASCGDFTSKIELEWQGAEKASAYDVYRSEQEDGSSAVLRERISGLKYQDTIDGPDRGKNFYYYVKAVNSAGATGIKSGLAMGYSLAEGAPPSPGNAGLDPDSGRGNSSDISIGWNTVTGAIKYVVYRYTDVDSALVKVGEVAIPSFTDPGPLKAQVYYYYKVQAVVLKDGVEVKGAFSNTEVEAFILGPPRSAEAEQEDGGTSAISWFPALGGDAEQAVYTYHIYGADDETGPWAPVHTVSAPASVEPDGRIHAANVPSRSFYHIVTENGLVQSDPGTAFAPFARAAVDVFATQRVYLDGKSPNDPATGVYPVKVTWKKPGGIVPASYHVYRSTSPDSAGRAVTTSPIPYSDESAGEFTWFDTDPTVKPGTRYYYRVLSLNPLEKGKYYSETKMGYGALTHDAWFKEYVKTVNKSLSKLVNMNKSGSTEKLGDETKSGSITGSIHYDTPDSVFSAIPPFDIFIEYSNYADFYIGSDSSLGLDGRYFILNGNSNTRVGDLQGNGTMNGTVTAAGMYPGTVGYGGIVIVNQEAKGGNYVVTPTGTVAGNVSWELGKR
jgi:hypothetical protein